MVDEVVPNRPDAQWPCYEVGGFGHYCYHPQHGAPPELRDWPPVWATALWAGPSNELRLCAVYASADQAHSDARRMAAHLAYDREMRRDRLLEDMGPVSTCPVERQSIEQAIPHEHVLHGLLTSEGMLALTAAMPQEALAARIVACQLQIAFEILIATERALRLLPSSVRPRIYAHAFCARALMEAAAPAPVALSLLARVTNGPPDEPREFRIHAEWVIDMAPHATINDFKRQIHSLLWGVNMARPLGERLLDSEMEALNLDLACHEDRRTTRYLSGTRRLSQLLGRLGEPPEIYVFV